MRRFDCLAADSPLWGPHLLEASAGTGKTFSIEHIFVRLLLESKEPPIEVEQILVVTFTRAAARELKSRIRSTIETALHFLKREEAKSPPYLVPYFGSKEAILTLSDACSAFDRAQIFTIHGFCYRMLQEFAFEAKMGFSLPNPDGEQMVPEKLQAALGDFLQVGLNEELLCPEQCAYVLKDYQTMQKLKKRLLVPKAGQGIAPFATLVEKFREVMQEWPVDEAKLQADFDALEKSYKVCKGDLKGQVAALSKGISDPATALRFLIKEKGTLFHFLDPENRKLRGAPPAFLHYPGFFDWACRKLRPLLNQKWIQAIEAAWQSAQEKIQSEEQLLSPDEVLAWMSRAVELPPFSKCVRQKYAAAIIDEFQDTDRLQWDIFRTLFASHTRALYLVGDPKQSIYRFRKADIYTYFDARTFLGEEHLYHLDTNFRSSKKLVGALNALFEGEWLKLPKEKKSLPYLPVQSGATIESEFGDEKGALHFFFAEEEQFLPYVRSEIERSLPTVGRLGHFALLVKDRYESERALQFFRDNNMAAVARSRTALGHTLAFQAVRELFSAIALPRDFSLSKILSAGPFGPFDFPLAEYQILLEERGLVPFCRQFFDTIIEGQSIKERSIAFDLSFYRDVMQIFEKLFKWEKNTGFSFEGLKRELAHLHELEAEEGGGRRMETDPDAVQVMTLHASKGLEFDVVFALGLATRTPANHEELEEFDAEKLRLLYVAMTRAKKRLYVPISSGGVLKSGTHSPIQLFGQHLGGNLKEKLGELSEKVSLTVEEVSTARVTSAPPKVPLRPDVSHPPIAPVPFAPFYLSSFSSLAKGKESEGEKWIASEEKSLHTMPRGTDTGILIHHLFEKIFSSPEPIWREEEKWGKIVTDLLSFTALSPWNEAIQEMVRKTLTYPLQAGEEFFSLSELEPQNVQVEMEFVFSEPPHFIKGFIDLVFLHREKIYFLDWKTNWLGNGDASYGPDATQNALQRHDYLLQAALYAEALSRHFPDCKMGRAIYYFLRGNSPVYIYPNCNLIQESYGR